MKKALLVISMIALLVFASCSSTETTEVAADPNAMPEWVYTDMSTQDVHYAVGYGKMSNQMNSIKRAQSEARNAIAEWVNISVEEIITTYTNDAGSDANRQAMDAFETLSKQTATAVLSGAKQENMWIDEEGGVYILMSIPVENVASQFYGAAEEAIAETPFVKNEAAAEANSMMNDAIAKYFGGGAE